MKREAERRGGAIRWGRLLVVLAVLGLLAGVTFAITSSVLATALAVIVGLPVILFASFVVLGAMQQRRAIEDARGALELGSVAVRLDPEAKTFAIEPSLPSGALAIWVLYLFDALVLRFGATSKTAGQVDFARKLIPSVGAWAQSRGKGELSVITPYKKAKDGGPAVFTASLLRTRRGYRLDLAEPLDARLHSGLVLTSAFPAIAAAVLEQSDLPSETTFALLESLSAGYTRGERAGSGDAVSALLAKHPAFLAE